MSLLPKNESVELQVVDEISRESLKLDMSCVDINPLTCKTVLLPHLARQFKVDINGLVESEARDLISSAFEIHRHAGTLYAVERALKSVFSDAKTVEWFDYSGEPYHFKVDVTLGTNPNQVFDTAKFEKCKELVNIAKNVRSVFESFNIKMPVAKGEVLVNTATNLKLSASSTTKPFKNAKGEVVVCAGAIMKIKSDLKTNQFKEAKSEIFIQGGCIWQI